MGVKRNAKYGELTRDIRRILIPGQFIKVPINHKKDSKRIAQISWHVNKRNAETGINRRYTCETDKTKSFVTIKLVSTWTK